MHVVINGKRWRLVRERLKSRRDMAHCDHPDMPGKRIVVDARLTGVTELDTIIHEMLHAGDWSKDEEWVEQVGTDIARVLWRLGYRKAANHAP